MLTKELAKPTTELTRPTKELARPPSMLGKHLLSPKTELEKPRRAPKKLRVVSGLCGWSSKSYGAVTLLLVVI